MISELRTHGVEAGYYQSIKAVDPRLSIDDITQLRTHGVEPEYYQEVKAIDPEGDRSTTSRDCARMASSPAT